jgi:hypothetical protein
LSGAKLGDAAKTDLRLNLLDLEYSRIGPLRSNWARPHRRRLVSSWAIASTELNLS